MDSPIWPNVTHAEYLNERSMPRVDQRADRKITPRIKLNHTDRLATLVVLSKTYAVSEASIADFIASLLQGLA
ncbi:MAG: hypothetical protein JWQ58_907 [Reyranella sp.]|nr:hypothetical protein [Reyranella sp.]